MHLHLRPLFYSVGLFRAIRQNDHVFDHGGLSDNAFVGILIGIILRIRNDRIHDLHAGDDLGGGVEPLCHSLHTQNTHLQNRLGAGAKHRGADTTGTGKIDHLTVFAEVVKLAYPIRTHGKNIHTVFFNIGNFLTLVFFHDDLVSDAGLANVFDTLCQMIGEKKQDCVMFEDALYAARTAKKHGYNLVGIFDPSEEETEELKRISDIYIHNYEEIDF